ncbi:MAG TPA: serine/threonine-protein kinase [Planctomycetota bacterium]|nr:serine/threonine-protein kinase [Planctomycetota bacterium]
MEERPARAGGPGASLDPPTDGGRPTEEVRFLPGAVIGGRYRIVSLLGRGGMGEVYRADDLKVGQAVALKFLPEGLERDRDSLGRLLNEVRLALRVTHANVCRVHDVGEVEGQHFLSMEYVDGEDLASLLRRIGRLPRDKAIQIARQLCAGLSVAHAQGILHRDLKPANVMLDGRGQAKIMDFGLAGLEASLRGGQALAGTPAYMAPEQFDGGEVTVRTDLYSLGLVLYELLAGRPPFDARSMTELARARLESTPTPPSGLVEGVDPAVERVILRCLARDPADRPASALAVAAALPGGDLLAAALAAGETPAPEVVADAGGKRGLSPRVAGACLAVFLGGLGALFWTSARTQLSQIDPLKNPPEVLVAEARGLLARLGYGETPGDEAFGFSAMRNALWPAILFWYRRSPLPLVPLDKTQVRADPFDPPNASPGMVRIWTGTDGRLESFGMVPPAHERAEGPFRQPDWKPLLEAARLDPGSLKPVEPRSTPSVNTDVRAAWEGTIPLPRDVKAAWEGRDVEPADIPVRVEAGGFQGRAVYFNTIWPWDAPPEESVSRERIWDRLQGPVGTGWYLGVLVGGALLARRNLRLGRGDRRGALRLALFVFATRILSWVLGGHHLATRGELDLLIGNLSQAVYGGVFVWVLYLAIEPSYRRFWPGQLISWVRLLSGRLRDPLVGRDLLFGAVYGVGSALIGDLYHLLPRWLSLPAVDISGFSDGGTEMVFLRGPRHALSVIVGSPGGTAVFVLIGVTGLVLLRMVLRRSWPAWALWVILGAILFHPRTGPPVRNLSTLLALYALALFVLLRFGFLSLWAGQLVSGLLSSGPLTSDLSRWFAGSTLLTLAAVVGLAWYSFYISLGGRPLFADRAVRAEVPTG